MKIPTWQVALVLLPNRFQIPELEEIRILTMDFDFVRVLLLLLATATALPCYAQRIRFPNPAAASSSLIDSTGKSTVATTIPAKVASSPLKTRSTKILTEFDPYSCECGSRRPKIVRNDPCGIHVFSPGTSAIHDLNCPSGCPGDLGCFPTTNCDSCEFSTFVSRFVVSADSLFLQRDNSSINQPIVLNDVTLNTISTTHDLGFTTAVGPRLAASTRRDSGRCWELSYFGLHSWHSSSTATGNDNLRIPGDIALATLDFLGADTMQIDYSANLHNAELNLTQDWFLSCMPIQSLIGFRYVRLAEEFDINSTDLDTGTSDYEIESSNNLIGAQTGLRLMNCRCRWKWELSGKAGVYANVVKQSTFLGDFDNSFVFRDLSVDGGRASFVGELGMNLEYRITANWSIRGGYNLLWIEGVALAPDQLDFSDTPESSHSLDRSAGVFMHGANVGLLAQW